MAIKANFKGVEAWSGGSVLPPGKHRVVIADVEETTSSNGNDQIKVRFEGLGNQAGSAITDWITVNENTLGRVLGFLRAAGLEVPEDEFEIPTGRLLDQQLTIVVREERIEQGQRAGEMTAKVKAYLPAEAGSDIPADTAGLSNGGGGGQDDLPF
jgi:hypothetical protein